MASQGEREEEESGGQTKNFIPLTLGLWFIEKSAERKVVVWSNFCFSLYFYLKSSLRSLSLVLSVLHIFTISVSSRSFSLSLSFCHDKALSGILRSSFTTIRQRRRRLFHQASAEFAEAAEFSLFNIRLTRQNMCAAVWVTGECYWRRRMTFTSSTATTVASSCCLKKATKFFAKFFPLNEKMNFECYFFHFFLLLAAQIKSLLLCCLFRKALLLPFAFRYCQELVSNLLTDCTTIATEFHLLHLGFSHSFWWYYWNLF